MAHTLLFNLQQTMAVIDLPLIKHVYRTRVHLSLIIKIKFNLNKTYVAICSIKPPLSTVMLPSVTFLSTSSPQQ